MKPTVDYVLGKELMHSHALEDIADLEIANAWYGVSRQEGQTSTTLLRIGNMAMHHAITGLPAQNAMRRCLITPDGVVTYLNAYDTTKLENGAPADLTGASGNVMVEIPEHYARFWTSSDWNNAAVSMYPLSGFTKVERHYISAYEAALDRTNLKAASVVNLTTQFRGGNNTNWDAESRSLLGKPVTSLTRAQERTYCSAIGTGWCEEPFQYFSPWRWLAIIEFANTNIQEAINTALTVNGYRQGGLGNGVTTADGAKWNTFNTNNPFVPCGVTNSLGNQSGEVSYTAIDFDGVGVNKVFVVPSYRGIENPFGHIWKRLEGINIESSGYPDSHFVKGYVKNGVTGFSDGTSDGYTQIGNLPTSSNYILNLWWGNSGIFLPKIVGGGATTGWCDYYYAPSSNGWFAPLSSANAISGSSAGIAYVYANYSAATAAAYFGFRLCFTP